MCPREFQCELMRVSVCFCGLVCVRVFYNFLNYPKLPSQRRTNVSRESVLTGVSHDDFAAFVVVSLNAHLLDILGSGDAERLVDLVFHRKSVRVPAETTLHVVTCLMRVTRHRVFAKKR